GEVVRVAGTGRTVHPAAHWPLVAFLVVMTVLAERPVVFLTAERAPLELAIAAAQQVDGPDEHRAAGLRDAIEQPLVRVPVGRGVELEPLRLAPGLHDLLVALRALIRLNLQDPSGLGRARGAALALGVVRLERRDRTEEERRVPRAAEQRDRRVQPRRVRAQTLRPQ